MVRQAHHERSTSSRGAEYGRTISGEWILRFTQNDKKGAGEWILRFTQNDKRGAGSGFFAELRMTSEVL